MLVLLAAAALLGGTPTISGTITANTGASLTVSSNDRALTCSVLGATGQAAIRRWGTGVRAVMQCKQHDGKLVVTRLTRLGTKEDPPPTTTTAPTTTTTQTETRPVPLPPAPAPAPPEMLTVGGTVVYLSGDGVALKPDRGGEVVKCAITPAAYSQKARESLTVGAHVGIACRLDGGRYVLAYAKPIS